MGAGGHGAVVAEAALLSQAWKSIAFLEDDPSRGKEVVGCPIVDQTSSFAEFLGDDYEFFVALGDNKQRSEILSSIEEKGGVLARIVHPAAVISQSASIGAGTVVCAGAVINARASIARGCIINTSASIDHDCVLGDSVHISPGTHLAGGVQVGDRSWLGIGSSVLVGVRIGEDAIIGAGAVVLSDVPANSKVVGVPARPIR